MKRRAFVFVYRPSGTCEACQGIELLRTVARDNILPLSDIFLWLRLKNPFRLIAFRVAKGANVTKHPIRHFPVARRRRSEILGIPVHCVKKAEIMILTHESRGCDGESTSGRIKFNYSILRECFWGRWLISRLLSEPLSDSKRQALLRNFRHWWIDPKPSWPEIAFSLERKSLDTINFERFFVVTAFYQQFNLPSPVNFELSSFSYEND